MKKLALVFAVLALIVAFPILAGEWHTGTNNLCADCHTMHNSMAHTWNGAGVVTTTPSPDGNWTPGGPDGHEYLLKAADPDALCLACHDGQNWAPDVMGANATAVKNRAAGFLNNGGADAHKGHTLGSTAVPPGYISTAENGGAGDWYDESHGLECISCHTQHGRAGVYRNLGPRNGKTPTYAIAGRSPVDVTTANYPTTYGAAAVPPVDGVPVDIFINTPGYLPNKGAGQFEAFYEADNVYYIRRATPIAVGANKSDNAAGAQCAACHGNFHGNAGDATVDGVVAAAPVIAGSREKFTRHPTGGQTIGGVGGGHSDPIASRYGAAANKNRVKAYVRGAVAGDTTDATPGCISCHKAHGNGNPFGLIFAERTAVDIDGNGVMTENGTFISTGTSSDTARGMRGLCGQCHRQGL